MDEKSRYTPVIEKIKESITSRKGCGKSDMLLDILNSEETIYKIVGKKSLSKRDYVIVYSFLETALEGLTKEGEIEFRNFSYQLKR